MPSESKKTKTRKGHYRYKRIDFSFDLPLAKSLVGLGAKNLAALGTSPLQNLPASRGHHSLEEPVDPCQGLAGSVPFCTCQRGLASSNLDQPVSVFV